MLELTAKNVEDVMLDMLFKDEELAGSGLGDEPPEGVVVVKAITSGFGFHPGRVKENKGKVIELIGQLDEKFLLGSGDGYSFLALCEDKEGKQWTGEHRVMELLCVVAIAAGVAKWSMPRDLWAVLPGGMPYVTFSPEGFDDVSTED